MTYARRLLEAGVRLIDIAADFRLRDRENLGALVQNGAINARNCCPRRYMGCPNSTGI